MRKPYQDKELLRELYVDRDMTQREIADELQCSDTTISNYLKKYGIETGGLKHHALNLDKPLLVDMYVERGMTQEEIADELECSGQTISEYVRNYGIETGGRGNHRLNLDKELLVDMYVERGMSAHKISVELECSERTVRTYLKKYGIEIRTVSDYYDTPLESRKTAEYRMWRQQVYERDNNTCQDCGATEGLQAHHIVPMSESKEKAHDVDNGVVVCYQCHADRHEVRGDHYAELIRNSYREE